MYYNNNNKDRRGIVEMETVDIGACKKIHDRTEFYHTVRLYILQRFSLEMEVSEENLLELAKQSLRKQVQEVGLTETQLEHAFSKTDCRKTNSIVKKKVLLIMHLEKKLDVRLDDIESTQIETVRELAEALFVLCEKKYE